MVTDLDHSQSADLVKGHRSKMSSIYYHPSLTVSIWEGAYKQMQWSLRFLKTCLSPSMMISLRPVRKGLGKGWKIVEPHGKWWIIQGHQAEHGGLNRNNHGSIQTVIICTWNKMEPKWKNNGSTWKSVGKERKTHGIFSETHWNNEGSMVQDGN